MEPEETAAGVVAGAFAALVLSFVLVPVRSSGASAIIALLLVLPVLLGALVGGRLAGASAAVASTLCFDFFFTQPYGSLKIDRAEDVETVLVLLVVALFAGSVAARARRSRTAAEEGRLDLEAVHRVAGLVARGAPPDVVVGHARRELEQLLVLRSVDYVEDSREGSVENRRAAGFDAVRVHHYQAGGFELPAIVELPAQGPFGEHGRFVLHTTPGQSVSAQQTRAAVIIADLVGASLDVHRRAVTSDGLHADHRWS